MEEILLGLLFLIVPALFFAPTILAIWKRQDSKGLVLLINIVGGWTFIGWLISLVMAIGGESKRTYSFSVREEDLRSARGVDSPQSLIEIASKKSSEKAKEIEKLYGDAFSSIGAILPFGLVGQTIIGFLAGAIGGFALGSVMADAFRGGDMLGIPYGLIFCLIATIYPAFERLVILPEKRNKRMQKASSIQAVKDKYDSVIADECKLLYLDRIHELGLMTVEDVQERIPELPKISVVVQKILDDEVRKGEMSKIDLNEGKVLYKSEQTSIADLESCETVMLEID